MPNFTPNSATILSLFPMPMDGYRRHNGSINYEHPAAKRDQIITRVFNPDILSNAGTRVPTGAKLFTDTVTASEVNQGYTLLRVWDTFTWTRDWTQDKEVFVPRPLTAKDVATDLQSSWAGNGLQGEGGKPGIVIIAGEVPTAEELAAVTASQEVYFRGLINQGHSLYSQQRFRDISDLHREAAKWMGANGIDWVAKIQQMLIKKCAACADDINQNALVCKHCGTNLVKFHMEMGTVPDAKLDPVVFAALDAKTKKKAA